MGQIHHGRLPRFCKWWRSQLKSFSKIAGSCFVAVNVNTRYFIKIWFRRNTSREPPLYTLCNIDGVKRWLCFERRAFETEPQTSSAQLAIRRRVLTLYCDMPSLRAHCKQVDLLDIWIWLVRRTAAANKVSLLANSGAKVRCSKLFTNFLVQNAAENHTIWIEKVNARKMIMVKLAEF